MKFRVVFLLAVLAVVLVAAIVLAQKTQRFELESLSPRFRELISSRAELERVATGFGFTEGPMWDPAGFLYVSDETINKIFRVSLDPGTAYGQKTEVISLGDPDGNSFD